MIRRIPDNGSYSNNIRLAEVIKKYWAKHGLEVNVWAEPVELRDKKRGHTYCIKSDVVERFYER